MLTITIPGDELWDEENEKFLYTPDVTLEFEHSLVSLSKWEAKYKKLFLSNDKPTEEEMMGYVEAMLLTPNVAPEVLRSMTVENVEALEAYINDPMTGTTINELQSAKRSTERLSSELVYYWMGQMGIDKECEEWHLNRLFTLIRVYHAKSEKPKKMSQSRAAQTMAEINAQRKAALGTKG